MTATTPNFEPAWIRSLFDHDPQTGNLVWKVKRGFAYPGLIAGTLDQGGFLKIHINRRPIAAHRLVWFWHHGTWPKFELLHLNGNKTDNRLENLADTPNRPCKLRERPRGASGFKGVVEQCGKFRARIQDFRLGGKLVHIGTYETAEEAEEGYREKHVEIHGIISPHFDEYHPTNPKILAAVANLRA